MTSVIGKLASQLGRQDEQPNMELAVEIASESETAHVHVLELIELLSHKDKSIQYDAIKVLYEIGAINPDLIKLYAPTFVELLRSRNNRIVWGAMTALSTIAQAAADSLIPYLEDICTATESGSVITVDKGILTLAKLAANETYAEQIIPFLLRHLETCRPKDVPQHAESIMIAISAKSKEAFLAVLRSRVDSLTEAQAKRVNRIIKALIH